MTLLKMTLLKMTTFNIHKYDITNMLFYFYFNSKSFISKIIYKQSPICNVCHHR
jgi:hypothetical protein